MIKHKLTFITPLNHVNKNFQKFVILPKIILQNEVTILFPPTSFGILHGILLTTLHIYNAVFIKTRAQLSWICLSDNII